LRKYFLNRNIGPWRSGKKRKKISTIRGDVLLESSSQGSAASLEALEKATNLLDDILEQVSAQKRFVNHQKLIILIIFTRL
jgi:hypothetical protein